MIVTNLLALSLTLFSLNSGKMGERQGSSSSSVEMTIERLVKNLQPRILDCDSSPYWIGVAGGPGSGKTSVAEKVADRLNYIKTDSALVIPMDGWHIPQSDLIAKYGDGAMKRRGADWTFDLESMANQLLQAKEDSKASLPIYSREISDPVPNGVTLKPHHKIVLVEGLYLLCKDQYPKLFSLWDECWFVQAPSREEQIERLVNRSLKTWTKAKAAVWGPGEVGARKRVESNDCKNMDFVDPSRHYAQEIIVND